MREFLPFFPTVGTACLSKAEYIVVFGIRNSSEGSYIFLQPPIGRED